MSNEFYFVKKVIFTELFFLFIILFSVGNILSYTDDYKDIVSRFASVRSIKDFEKSIGKAEDAINSDIAGQTYFIEIYIFPIVSFNLATNLPLTSV